MKIIEAILTVVLQDDVDKRKSWFEAIQGMKIIELKKFSRCCTFRLATGLIRL